MVGGFEVSAGVPLHERAAVDLMSRSATSRSGSQGEKGSDRTKELTMIAPGTCLTYRHFPLTRLNVFAMTARASGSSSKVAKSEVPSSAYSIGSEEGETGGEMEEVGVMVIFAIGRSIRDRM